MVHSSTLPHIALAQGISPLVRAKDLAHVLD